MRSSTASRLRFCQREREDNEKERKRFKKKKYQREATATISARTLLATLKQTDKDRDTLSTKSHRLSFSRNDNSTRDLQRVTKDFGLALSLTFLVQLLVSEFSYAFLSDAYCNSHTRRLSTIPRAAPATASNKSFALPAALFSCRQGNCSASRRHRTHSTRARQLKVEPTSRLLAPGQARQRPVIQSLCLLQAPSLHTLQPLLI